MIDIITYRYRIGVFIKTGCGRRASNKHSYQYAHMASLDGAWEELFLIAFPFFYSYVSLLAMLLGLHLDNPASAFQSNIPCSMSSFAWSLPTPCHCYIKTALLIIMKNLKLNLKKNICCLLYTSPSPRD